MAPAGDEILLKCVDYGCVKINYSTDFKQKFRFLKKEFESHEKFILALYNSYDEKWYQIFTIYGINYQSRT